MNRIPVKQLLATAVLAAVLAGPGAATQIDTAHTCCLAQEWFAPATGSSAQSSGEFCCVASEWQAGRFVSPDGEAERAVQGQGKGCCLANEWHSS